MMPDPSHLQRIALDAVRAASADTRGEDPRSRQAQLSFSAMLAAVQSGCSCEACQLLREAVEAMRVRPKQEAPPYGPGDNPQT